MWEVAVLQEHSKYKNVFHQGQRGCWKTTLAMQAKGYCQPVSATIAVHLSAGLTG